MLTTQNQNAPRTKTTYQKWEGRVMLVLVVAAASTLIDRYMVAAAIRNTESTIAAIGLTPEEERIAVCTVRYFVYNLEMVSQLTQLADQTHNGFLRICGSVDAKSVDAKKSGPPAR